MVPAERLPDVGGCLGLNPIFLASLFHPSGNLVALVLLMIGTHPVSIGARPHVQRFIEKSDRCS